jgi:AraC-like DNA-binding protein
MDMSQDKLAGLDAHASEHQALAPNAHESGRQPRHIATESTEIRAIRECIRSLARLDSPARLPALSAVARHFGITPRTLQRRLRERGATFRLLVNAVRLELATMELASSATVVEAAEAAGFSEASSFHRAFKRWTGHTPKRSAPTYRSRER